MWFELNSSSVFLSTGLSRNFGSKRKIARFCRRQKYSRDIDAGLSTCSARARLNELRYPYQNPISIVLKFFGSHQYPFVVAPTDAGERVGVFATGGNNFPTGRFGNLTIPRVLLLATRSFVLSPPPRNSREPTSGRVNRNSRTINHHRWNKANFNVSGKDGEVERARER